MLKPVTQSINPTAQLPKPGATSPDGDFGKMLMDVLKEVNAGQQESLSKQNAFLTGQPVDVHDVMIAMERANVSLQLTMQVRNKLLESYQEIMKMQV